MSERRSHLQRTAKDAVYAAELAAKEGGSRVKSRAHSSSRGKVAEVKGSDSVAESPNSSVKRKQPNLVSTKPSENWACSLCNLTNSSRKKHCLICQTHRSSQKSTEKLETSPIAKRRQNLPSLSRPQKDEIAPNSDCFALINNADTKFKTIVFENHQRRTTSPNADAVILPTLRSDDHSKSCSLTLGGNFAQSEEYLDCKPNTLLVDAGNFQSRIRSKCSPAKEEQATLSPEKKENPATRETKKTNDRIENEVDAVKETMESLLSQASQAPLSSTSQNTASHQSQIVKSPASDDRSSKTLQINILETDDASDGDRALTPQSSIQWDSNNVDNQINRLCDNNNSAHEVIIMEETIELPLSRISQAVPLSGTSQNTAFHQFQIATLPESDERLSEALPINFPVTDNGSNVDRALTPQSSIHGESNNVHNQKDRFCESGGSAHVANIMQKTIDSPLLQISQAVLLSSTSQNSASYQPQIIKSTASNYRSSKTPQINLLATDNALNDDHVSSPQTSIQGDHNFPKLTDCLCETGKPTNGKLTETGAVHRSLSSEPQEKSTVKNNLFFMTQLSEFDYNAQSVEDNEDCSESEKSYVETMNILPKSESNKKPPILLCLSDTGIKSSKDIDKKAHVLEFDQAKINCGAPSASYLQHQHLDPSTSFIDFPIIPAFTTAGKGRTIEVTEQSLINANCLLNEMTQRRIHYMESSVSSLTNPPPKPSRFTEVDADIRKSTTEAELLSENGDAMFNGLKNKNMGSDFSRFDDHRTTTFATAGKGLVVQVSDHSLTHAERILNAATQNDSMPRATKTASILPAPPMFTRAGTGAAIKISEESIKKAELLCGDMDIYSYPPLSNFSAPQASATSTFSSNAKSCITPFNTAGKGRAISVSEKSMKQANHLLNDTKSNEKPASQPAWTPVFDAVTSLTEKSGPKLIASDSIEKLGLQFSGPVEKCRGSPAAANDDLSCIPRFTTAGKGFIVQVDADSLLQAERLLHGSLTTDASHDNVANCFSNTPMSKKNTDTFKNNAAIVTKPFTGQPIKGDNSRVCKETGIIQIKGNTPSVTPAPFKFTHICGTFSGKAISPTAFSKAAGILGHSLTPVSISAVQQVLDYGLRSSERENLLSAPYKCSAKDPSDFLSSSTTISLKDLDDWHGKTFSRSVSNLIYCGIHPLLLQVNSTTASYLVFSCEGFPSHFCVPQSTWTWKDAFDASSASEIYFTLIHQGYSARMLSKRWVANHYQWIVWSFAAMERFFPLLLCQRFCTRQRVVEKIKKRHTREVSEGIRPAIRKILNRDVAASSLMILCISRIFADEESLKIEKESSPIKEKVAPSAARIELTDGWYSVPAILDKSLSQLVVSGQISVGCKIAFCGAVLEGAGEGIDPLDEDYFPQSPQCQVALKLFRNSTRRARWDAKLGFCNFSLGGIVPAQFSNIHPDGGAVPLVDLILCRVYPLLYFEDASSQGGGKRILNESQEALARQIFESNHQLAIEKIIEQNERETVEYVDEQAPDVWKDMSRSNDPQFYYSNLDESDKITIDSWLLRKRELLQAAHQKAIEGAMSKELCVRRSTPFLRVRVKILRRAPIKSMHAANSTALLTIWEPSDDRINLLKEGKAIRLRNLSCRPQVDGEVQLSVNGKTSLEELRKPNSSVLQNSGYEERFFSPIIRLHIMSKSERCQYDFDVVGYIVHAHPVKDSATSSSIYMTDESGLLLRLERYFDSEEFFAPPWKMTKYSRECSLVYSFQNLKLINFDTVQNCAVALWTEYSAVCSNINERFLALTSFSKSKDGEMLLKRVSTLSSSYPIVGKGVEKLFFAVGQFLSLEEKFDTKMHAIAAIDCGDALLRANIGLECLRGIVGSTIHDEIHVLSKRLRNSGNYYSFVLKHPTNSSQLLEVVTLTKVDVSALVSSYHMA